MKRKLSFIFVSVFTIMCSFLLVGCFNFNKEKPHTHTYETTYSYNETHHWLNSTCGCNVVKKKGTHTYTTNVCTTCHYRRFVEYIDYEFVNNGNYYRVDGLINTRYLANIVIPDTYNGYPVKVISSYAFSSVEAKSVVIGANVEIIGSSAFSGNRELTSVTLNEKVKLLEESCFKNCVSLENITLPNSIQSIGKDAFANTKIKSITIPSSIESLKECFYNCQQLTSVTFNGAPSKFYGTFENCTSLETINLPDNITYIGLDTFSGCSNLKNITLPASLTSIHARAFLNCNQNIKVTFKGSLNDYAKISFAEYTSNPLHTSGELIIDGNIVTTIDSSVTTVNPYAFYNYDKLISIESGEGILEISKMAFYDCDALTSVTLPDSVTTIGESAFFDCDNLEIINISSSLETVGLYAFNSLNKLEQFVVDNENEHFASPDGNLYSKDVSILYQYALGQENTCYDAPSSLLEIKKSAFEESQLEEMTLNFVGASLNLAENTHFGYIFGADDYESNNLFVPSTLKTITIDSASIISPYCFYGLSNVTEFNLSNVTQIGDSAFSGCDGIEELNLPSSISGSNLARNAFEGLNNLKTLSVYEVSSNGHIYPASLKSLTIRHGEKLYNTLGSANHIESITLPDNLVNIEYDALKNFTNLKSISIPESVTSIGSSAFENCTSLTEITLPKNVTSVNGAVFKGCTSLKTVNLQGLVKFVGYRSFYECHSLTDINFADISALTTIRELAFAFTDISQLHLTKYTTEIGKNAFDHCYYLDDLTLPFIGETITTLPEYNYAEGCYMIDYFLPPSVNNLTILGGEFDTGFFEQGYSSVETLTLGEDISYIGAYAFSGCSNLQTVNFKNNPDLIIGVSAFNGCELLTKVNVDDIESWLNIYFSSQYSNPLYYAKNFYVNNVLAETISIPENITKVQQYAFYNCLSLKKLYLHDNFESFGLNALYGCDNLEFKTYSNLTYLSTSSNDYFAVYKPTTPYVTSISFNKNTQIIMSGAFDGCENISVIDISSVELWCKLNFTSNIPLVSNSVLKINGEKVTTIVIPSTITSINHYTFKNITSFTDVIIEEGVKELGEYAFINCTNLKNIKIPSTLETIKKSCFVGCLAVEKVDIPEVKDWFDITFEDYNANPLGNLENAYLYVNDVKTNEITVPETVRMIKQNAFAYVKTLTKITISNKTTTFSKDSFIQCPVDVYISDIDSWAGSLFANIDANPIYTSGNLYLNNVLLEDLTLTTQTIIGDYAFANCKNLKTFTSKINLLTIGDYAFYKCLNLTTVNFQVIDYIYDENIPKTDVGSYAFADCQSINTFYCGFLTTIGKYAFLNCNNFNKDTTDFVLSNTIRYNGYWRLYDGKYFYDDIREMYSNKALATLLVKTYVDKDWIWYFED